MTAQLLDLLHERGISTGMSLPASVDGAPGVSRRELAEAELARLSKEVHADALDLPAVVQGVCQLLDARLQQRCMAVQMTLPASVPPVQADRTLLRQALLNLLSYALDKLPDGARLLVTAQTGAGSVRLSVRQGTGDGMPAAAPLPPQRREGVALTVAQSLLAAQHAQLILDESSGAWAADIVLPTAQTPTILIVDDNQALVELFQRYLAGHRLLVQGATSGGAALAHVRQATPHAIVLDVMMPHQDGWEVLQMLRQEPACAETPIIVCSVLRERDLALSLGASDTLVKPVSQPALLDVLRRWLGTLHPV